MQNILVVEDDHDLNQAICYSLKKSGYGTYGAESAESGRTEFLRNRIDLVLLDVSRGASSTACPPSTRRPIWPAAC